MQAGEHPRGSKGLILAHSAVAAGMLGPALLIAYLVLRVPAPPEAIWIAVLVSAIFFAGIAFTLLKRGITVLRFITLVPAILAVALLLRLGAPALDQTQSARPIAQELVKMESTQLPAAVFHVRRETEYGLAFYRNQRIARYERGEIPNREHLLVAPTGSEPELQRLLNPRRVSRLGALDAQQLEYFWVQAAAAARSR
jgi:hypothetical protein